MSNKQAVGILRGIKDRIENLEEAVTSEEGVPNILRFAEDRATGDDTATVEEGEVGGWEWNVDATWAFKEWADGRQPILRETVEASATTDVADTPKTEVVEAAGVAEVVALAVEIAPEEPTTVDDPTSLTKGDRGDFTWGASSWSFAEWDNGLQPILREVVETPTVADPVDTSKTEVAEPTGVTEVIALDVDLTEVEPATTADPTTATEQSAGGFTWGTSDWGFAEWG